MNLLFFKSIKNKLIFWLVIMSLLPLLIVMGVTYQQRVAVIQSRTFSKLSAIRDLKVERVNDWLAERNGDLNMMSKDRELGLLEGMVSLDNQGVRHLEDTEFIRIFLSKYLDAYVAYNEIFIINPLTGRVNVSTDKKREGVDVSNLNYFKKPMKTRKLFTNDINYSEELSSNTMTFSMPVVCFKHNGEHVIGIIVERINLDVSLYRILQDRVGLGDTGETLIVNSDGIALSELRWFDNAPMKLKISAEPAVNAAHGMTGITVTEDYRGEEVLAAYTYIPETQWGFVSKQDLYESNAPIREMLVTPVPSVWP